MRKLTRIGMDTSKSVFQLHGVDDDEQPALRRKLRRQDLNKFFGNLPRLWIGMESLWSFPSLGARTSGVRP